MEGVTSQGSRDPRYRGGVSRGPVTTRKDVEEVTKVGDDQASSEPTTGVRSPEPDLGRGRIRQTEGTGSLTPI